MSRLSGSAARVAAACSIFALAACQDSTAPAAADRFTPEEAREVAFALLDEALTVSDADGATLDASVAARATPPMSGKLMFDVPCRLGGRIAGDVTYSSTIDQNGTGALDIGVSLTPTACVVPAGEKRGTVTLTGAPSVTYTFKQALTGWMPSGGFEATAKGGLTWAGGSCMLDYRVVMQSQTTAVVTGTVCGVDIGGTYPIDGRA